MGKAAALCDVLLKSLGEKLLQRNLHGCNITGSHFSLLNCGTGVQRCHNLASDSSGGWLRWKPAENRCSESSLVVVLPSPGVYSCCHRASFWVSTQGQTNLCVHWVPVSLWMSWKALKPSLWGPLAVCGCSSLRATTQLKAAARTEGTQMLALTSLESALHLRQTLPSTQVSPVENPRVVPASDNCNKSLKIGFTLPPCCFFPSWEGEWQGSRHKERYSEPEQILRHNTKNLYAMEKDWVARGIGNGIKSFSPLGFWLWSRGSNWKPQSSDACRVGSVEWVVGLCIDPTKQDPDHKATTRTVMLAGILNPKCRMKQEWGCLIYVCG